MSDGTSDVPTFSSWEACPTGHVYIVTMAERCGGHVKRFHAFGTVGFGAEGPVFFCHLLWLFHITPLKAPPSCVRGCFYTSKAIRVEIRWIFRETGRLAEEYLLAGSEISWCQHAVLARIASADRQARRRVNEIRWSRQPRTSGLRLRQAAIEEKRKRRIRLVPSSTIGPDAKSIGQFLQVQFEIFRPGATRSTPTAGSSHQPKAGDR